MAQQIKQRCPVPLLIVACASINRSIPQSAKILNFSFRPFGDTPAIRFSLFPFFHWKHPKPLNFFFFFVFPMFRNQERTFKDTTVVVGWVLEHIKSREIKISLDGLLASLCKYSLAVARFHEMQLLMILFDRTMRWPQKGSALHWVPCRWIVSTMIISLN